MRPDASGKVLAHCPRVKAARLCVLRAGELGPPWADAARQGAGRRLGHPRWTARLKDGTALALKA